MYTKDIILLLLPHGMDVVVCAVPAALITNVLWPAIGAYRLELARDPIGLFRANMSTLRGS